MRTVAVDILTGFLGSGETTLLRHVLEHGLRGKPVAVIMNGSGEVGIDGKVVTGLANVEKMVELTSGCICCSIDDYRFDLAIQEIIDTAQPHLVIIESTGLADPEPLAYRVKSAGLGLDAVITVVDAANVERQLAETKVARAQIEAADFLVVNKLDLVDAPDVARLERRLAKLNPRAERMKTVRGALDSDVLFATGVATFRATRAGSRPRLPPARSARKEKPSMAEHRPEAPAPPSPEPPEDAAYSDEEEAEVRKRLEDLGYVE